MANEIPDTKATIHRLLTSIGIRRVVYVDDLFSASIDRVNEACDDLQLDQIRGTELFPETVFEVDDPDVSRSRIRTHLEGMDRRAIMNAFAALAEVQGKGINKSDAVTVEAFVNFFDGDIRLVCLNLPQYRLDIGKLLADVPASETLFVFDEDFSHDGGSEQEGHRLAAQLIAQLGDQTTFLTLLTHTVPKDGKNETDKQEDIGRDEVSLKDRIVVIAKGRLADPQEGFAWRFKLALLTRHFYALKAHLQESIGRAHAKADEQINEFDIRDFERIIFHTSHNEGAWAPETLTRVFGIHYSKQLLRSFRGLIAVHELSENARQLCQVPTDNVSNETKQRAVDLHRIERYDEHQVVNALHLPLELGDVFKTTPGDERIFVLLGQPCDLAVRSYGLRREVSALDQGFLAVMAEIEFSSRKPEKKPQKSWEHFLPWFDGGDARYAYANLTKIFAFPAWLVDFTVFNADGSCRLARTNASLPLLIPAWRLRQEKLIEHAEQRLAKFRTAGSSDSELLQMVLALPPGGPFRAEQPGGENDWCLSVNIQRVRRIREPFATDIYTHYGHWITRAGFPHELTRLEAKTVE